MQSKGPVVAAWPVVARSATSPYEDHNKIHIELKSSIDNGVGFTWEWPKTSWWGVSELRQDALGIKDASLRNHVHSQRSEWKAVWNIFTIETYKKRYNYFYISVYLQSRVHTHICTH